MENKLEQNKNKEPKPKKKAIGTTKLLKDVWRYIWGEDESAKDLQKDLGDIDAERSKKRLKEAKKQQKIEAVIRQKAEVKARQAQARLVKQQKEDQRLQVKKDKAKQEAEKKELEKKKKDVHKKEIIEKNKGQQAKKPGFWATLFASKPKDGKKIKDGKLFKKQSKKSTAIQDPSLLFGNKKIVVEDDGKDDGIVADKDKAFQHLVENKKQEQSNNIGAVNQNLLASDKSAFKAGLLKRIDRQEIKPQPQETKVQSQGMKSPIKKGIKTKKPSLWSSLFSSKPKQLATKSGVKVVEPVVKKSEVKEAPVKQSDYDKHKSKHAKRLAAEREKYANLKIRQDIENRYWHSHNIVRANLIKDQKSLFFNWHSKVLTLILAVGLGALTVGVLYGALLVWESNKLNDNQYIFKNLETINQEVKSEESITEEIMDFNDKLILVDFMLDNHIYWSTFFSMLEDYTVYDVYYEGFQGDLNGTYALSTVARDYRAVYLQLKLMQQYKHVLSADTESAKILRQQLGSKDEDAIDEPDKIKFILDLVLDRKIFLK